MNTHLATTTPMLRVAMVTAVGLAAVIVGAVLWALPVWAWTFAISVAVGAGATRQGMQRR